MLEQLKEGFRQLRNGPRYWLAIRHVRTNVVGRTVTTAVTLDRGRAATEAFECALVMATNQAVEAGLYDEFDVTLHGHLLNLRVRSTFGAGSTVLCLWQ